MGNITKLLGHPAIQFWGSGGLVAVITWILTSIAQVPLWQVWLAILFSIGWTVWVVILIRDWKERHKKKLTQLSNKELEALIWEWLKISAWKVSPQPLQDATLFAYQVEFQDKLITIVRESHQPDIISLISVFTMPSEKEGLSEAERNRLGGQLNIEFARLGIQWNYVETPDTVRLIESIILDDSMTPYYFRSRIMFIVRANILAYELWKEAIRSLKQSTPDKKGSRKK